MRIGIEAQRIFRKKKHGMDIVALELIKALQTIDDENSYFIFVKKGEDSACLKETHNFKIIEVPGISYADWEQIMLPYYANKYKLDILHCTSNTAPVFCKVPTVITLHDIIFLEKKNSGTSTQSLYQQLGRIYRKIIVPAVIRKTKHIITVSQFERNIITDKLNISQEKISVIYNSFGKHFLLPENSEKLLSTISKYNLPGKYIFYIGNTDPKKNMFNTVSAYINYARTSADPIPLLVADVDSKIIDSIASEIGGMNYRNYILTTGYILNNDLPFIYAGASLFLYPSLRESFGIPILEAMACGAPVISSNTSALPEIAGDAAILINPENINEITHAIHSSVLDKKNRNELIEKGLARTKLFSWINSAVSLKQIYQSI